LLGDNGYGQFDGLIPALERRTGESRGLRPCGAHTAVNAAPAMATRPAARSPNARGDVGRPNLGQVRTPASSAGPAPPPSGPAPLTAGRAATSAWVGAPMALAQGGRPSLAFPPTGNETRIAVSKRLAESDKPGLRGSASLNPVDHTPGAITSKRLAALRGMGRLRSGLPGGGGAPDASAGLAVSLVNWPRPTPRRPLRRESRNWEDGTGKPSPSYGPAAERLSGRPLPLGRLTLLLRAHGGLRPVDGASQAVTATPPSNLRSPATSLACVSTTGRAWRMHERFVSRLQQTFGAKWSFWQMLER